jgi:gas vesicle protein
MIMKTIKDFIVGSLLGIILGGLLGLLLTPHSGDENRRIIRQQYSETVEKVQDAVRTKQEELQGEIDLFTH